MKKRRVQTDKAEVYVFEDFLSHEDCDKVVAVIDEIAVRSTVIGGGGKDYKKALKKPTVSNFRTSSTASIRHQKYPFIRDIDRKISRAINVPLELGEVLQGQKYEVGQQFKDHTDFFGTQAMKAQKKMNWGDRTWTFMVYLNDDCVGGETNFRRLGIKFTPKKGMAVAWRNMSRDGKLNSNTLHAGLPVKEGTKYIITKWFRERPAGTYPVSERFKKLYPHLIVKHQQDQVPHSERVSGTRPKKTQFDSWEQLPRLTEKGFEVVDVPEETWKLIQSTYNKLLPRIKPEKFKGQMSIIYNEDKTESPVDIINLGYDKAAKAKIHEQLLPILKEWSGAKITPSMMYGIRSYKDGAILTMHRDRVKTHHVSCICLVDEKSDEPWALNIEDHDGNEHEVVIKPGQLILYESATCKHGRKKPFKGEYFRNFFIHYSLDDYEYVGNQQ